MALAQSPAVPSGQPSAGSVLQKVLATNGLLDGSPLKKKIVETVFIVLVGYLLMFGFIGIVNKRVKDIKARHTVRKNVIYIVSIALIIIIFFIWIQNINSITIFLGVAGAGLALALQEVILCIAGWFLILIRHPFEAGDRVEINGIKGDVIDIRLFQTSLLEIGNWVDADQSTGRIVNFPNSFVFKHENYNYSRGFEFIWHEIPILVTFESDWERGREIMMAHAKNLAEGLEAEVCRKIDAMRNRYMIYYGKFTPIVYVNIKDSGVELTLRYLTEAKKRRFTEDQLCQAILKDFEKESNVHFAYPTYRIVKT
ncbi:MAG: mechanosensitive ion channel family protein [Candidatus Omnitrophica bacterium]|nr:mechanosensitive ion channel family protein [Candidatus Omnitrophota bacterium]